MEDKEIRLAWYDRNFKTFDHGAWKDFKFIETHQKWACSQNKKYPRTKYWVEYRDKKDKIVKNIEEVTNVKIENTDDTINDYFMIE